MPRRRDRDRNRIQVSGGQRGRYVLIATRAVWNARHAEIASQKGSAKGAEKNALTAISDTITRGLEGATISTTHTADSDIVHIAMDRETARKIVGNE